MIRLGRVYSNLMIDMPATNEKLRNRAVRMVELAAGVTRPMAVQALARGGRKREAGRRDGEEGASTADEAERALAEHRGNLREVLGS